jgi:hypothetical protein
MQNNPTGTIYIFQESGTGKLLLKTTDISVLSGIVPSQIISRNEKVIIKDITYIVVGFEISISIAPPILHISHLMEIGENNPRDCYTIIYLKKKFNPLRILFYK